MNDHLPPVFRDLLNRQFAQVYPIVKPCPYCDDTGDVHRADGEWLGICTCPAGDQFRKPKHNEFLTDDRLAELQSNLHMKEPGQ